MHLILSSVAELLLTGVNLGHNKLQGDFKFNWYIDDREIDYLYYSAICKIYAFYNYVYAYRSTQFLALYSIYEFEYIREYL